MPSGHTAARPILLLSRGGVLDGAQRQVCHLVAAIDHARFVPHILLDEDGPFAHELRHMGAHVIIQPFRPWRSLRGMAARYVDARRAIAHARQCGAALVHAADTWKSPYALYVARALGVPSVIHMRGPLSARDIAKHQLAKASAIIAIGQRYRADLLAAKVPDARIAVIPDSVDVERFAPDPARRAAFRQTLEIGPHLAVGLVGRVEPFKRILEFLELAACVPRDAPVRFYVIGEPGPPAYMRQVNSALARLQLEKRVTFTGRLEQMPGVIAALDILVTLSGGSVTFEAMAAGKPVLSVTSLPRHPVHVRHGETAWCAQTDDMPAAAKELERLIADEALRQRLGACARAWAAKHLTTAQMARQTEDLYARLLTQSTL